VRLDFFFALPSSAPRPVRVFLVMPEVPRITGLRVGREALGSGAVGPVQVLGRTHLGSLALR
jgi:hypothetical protein